MNMKHTTYKQKHGLAVRHGESKSIHMEQMIKQKSTEDIRERFFRPAYGKIGERKEENNEGSNENY